MNTTRNWLPIERRSGKLLEAGGKQLVPESRSIRIPLPYGILLWSHPSGITIQNGSHQEYKPIADPTLYIQIVAYLISAFCLIAGLLLARGVRRDHTRVWKKE